MKLTSQFWGGALLGVGFGLMVGGTLVEHVALDHKLLILIPSLVLGAAGVSLTWGWRGPWSR